MNEDVTRIGSELLNTQIITLGGAPVTPATLGVLALTLILSWWLARLLERAFAAAMRRRGVRDEGSIRAVGRLVYYLVLVVGFGVGFDTAGFSLSALFAAGAVFAVGIGLAFQNLAQNFVSGIFLLLEQSITPGDVLEVEGRVVRVIEMRMRTTVARTRDEEDLIIPNSALVQNTVKNFSLKDSVYRLRVRVGVSYESDMTLVRRVLEEVGAGLPTRLEEHTPRVEMFELADSAVIWTLSVWIEDPWRSVQIRSQINETLWHALREAGIQFAYPQLDVHVRGLPSTGP